MGDALRIAIGDSHAAVSDCLTAVLNRHGHRVLCVSSTYSSLRANVRALRPDICILEVRLQDGEDFGSIARLADDSRHTKVIVLTADPSRETLHAALAAGVAGYVHKSRGPNALISALHRVAKGEIVVEASISRCEPVRERLPVRLVDAFAQLTPREAECLTLLALGHSTSTIAAHMGVSTTTVRSHVQAILTKTGAHSRFEAASLAMRHGFVPAAARTG
jgi:two-component system nitrate/nitrite response regulator NarL